jgi:ABC-type transporter Mla subunit MlaD
MRTKNPKARRTTKLSAIFDKRLSANLQAIRREVDRAGRTSSRGAESLTALKETAARLRVALRTVARRRAGDVADRLDELEYPFEKLQAYFARNKTALEKRATEILAEYIRDRMLEIRVIAKTLDARR